ncbi:hypothetical protein ACFS3C_22740 [Azotobacter vinelandii]
MPKSGLSRPPALTAIEGSSAGGQENHALSVAGNLDDFPVVRPFVGGKRRVSRRHELLICTAFSNLEGSFRTSHARKVRPDGNHDERAGEEYGGEKNAT